MTTPQPLYTPSFARVLLGATLTMVGVSMQFHFGEFIGHLGYGVDTLGKITGVGFVGGFLLRPVIGGWIDRVGCRPCFIVAACLGTVANLSFQFTSYLPFIYIARLCMGVANATFLTTVAAYAAKVAPVERRAESLGTIGIGGFIGMMIGPAIGDIIFAAGHRDDAFQIFFTTIAGASLLAGIIVAGVPSPTVEKHATFPSFPSLLRRHWPGVSMLVPIMMAAAIAVHMSFLERFAEERGFESIRYFYFVYATTAILIRIVLRDIPRKIGRRKACILGMSLMAAGLCLLTQVYSQWHLVFPAVVIGSGHALTFPSMIDLVADSLPHKYRGVGTSIALGGMDVGFFAAGYAWGELIAWQGFETTFLVAAGCTMAATVIFAWRQKEPSPDM